MTPPHRSRRRITLGERMRQAGFDRTRYDRSGNRYRIQCSQCEALVINGVATHETGCPNAPHAPKKGTDE